jgi:hypothetical protein
VVSNPGEALHGTATRCSDSAGFGRNSQGTARQLALVDVAILIGSIACFSWKKSARTGGFEQATVTSMTNLATIVTHAIITPGTTRRT